MSQIYYSAQEILTKLEKRQGTIKGLVFSSHINEKKRLFGLICETLKCIFVVTIDKSAIESVIEMADLLKTEKKLNKKMALLLTYELLIGNGISGKGALKQLMLKHKTRLKAEFTKLKIKLKATKNSDLIPENLKASSNLKLILVIMPKYVRINHNVSNMDAVLDHFKKQGFTEITDNTVFDLKPKTMRRDAHLQDLLLLPFNIDLHEHPLLLSGAIVIQEKASCFPAIILNPPKNSKVLDACAAPGNKTSHLSSIMKNTGKIVAFDADKRRLETLKKMCSRAKCSNIEPIHASFLEADPKKYADIEYILLDPSCSGSGIVGRMDHLIEPEETSTDRLESLQEFQVAALLHAFKFPNVKRVVYSTCSKHQQENEDVVNKVLSEQKAFKLAENVFPEWKTRGIGIPGSEAVIRTNPQNDHTIGFFVALFERIN